MTFYFIITAIVLLLIGFLLGTFLPCVKNSLKRFSQVSFYVLVWLAVSYGVFFIPKGREFLTWLSDFTKGFGGLAGVAAILGVFYSKSVKDRKETARLEKQAVEIKTAPNPTRADFYRELKAMFSEAERDGNKKLTVKACDLHKRVGGYPGPNHRIPICCSVMYAAKRDGDKILHETPSKLGSSVTIEYQLPRGSQDISNFREVAV